MRHILLLFPIFIFAVSCSVDERKADIHNCEEYGLKGNVSKVFTIEYSSPYKDRDKVSLGSPLSASYWEFSEDGLMTDFKEYRIDKESRLSDVIWNKQGNPIEYIRWGEENDFHEVSHFTYSYDLSGNLASTHDACYKWYLNSGSKKVTRKDMEDDTNGYQYIVLFGDTINGIRFTTEEGLTKLTIYENILDDKYEVRYYVHSEQTRTRTFLNGYLQKTEDQYGTDNYEYDGEYYSHSYASWKGGKSETEYKNGIAVRSVAYDSGNNITSQTSYKMTGTYPSNYTITTITVDQLGQENKQIVDFKDARPIRSKDISEGKTEEFEIKYNTNGDVISYVNNEGEQTTFKYAYDEQGNWIKRITSYKDNDLSTTTLRKIVYK